jgi:hypothetical protein
MSEIRKYQRENVPWEGGTGKHAAITAIKEAWPLIAWFVLCTAVIVYGTFCLVTGQPSFVDLAADRPVLVMQSALSGQSDSETKFNVLLSAAILFQMLWVAIWVAWPGKNRSGKL